jgi:hypothetical protein
MKRPLPQVNQQQVKVYRNLHANCLSVMEKGRVTGHAQMVRLTNVRFHVNQSGRDRVLTKQKKNAHAFVIGTLEETSAEVTEVIGIKVIYNPYKVGYFFVAETEVPVNEAKTCVVTPSGVFLEK